MLALDTERLEREKRVARFREQQERNLATQRQALQRKTETVQPDGMFDVTSMESQMGSPMTARQLYDRLKKFNPNLIYEVSRADSRLAGLYIIKPTIDENGFSRRDKVMVCGMESGWMPERTVRVPKYERQPDPDNPGEWITVETFSREIRGWRTVLARLVRQRLITMAQVEKHFPLNLNSRNWQVLTT